MAIIDGSPTVRIAVIVASMGRPDEIDQLLHQLDRQSVRPDIIVLSVTTSADLPADWAADWAANSAPDPGMPVRVIFGEAGSCAQRNRGLDAVLDHTDIVVFFDDDYLPGATALADIAGLLARQPDIVGVTGLVLRDGAQTGAVPYQEALDHLQQFGETPRPAPVNQPRHGLYGCNMAIRAAAIGDIRFDENLVRYGWQEDIDFSARVAAHGRLVMTTAFHGIHRGVTKSRTPGMALGYSQMVNPYYLVRKKTMPLRMALKLMAKNILANHAKSIRPETHIDRAGRARGNRLGLLDIVRGTAHPTRVLTLVPGRTGSDRTT